MEGEEQRVMSINRRNFILCAGTLAATAAFARPIRSVLRNGDENSIEPDIPSSAEYVQTGLIHMWDGIENVGWGVHSYATTKWKDLMGDFDLAAQKGAAGWGSDHAKISKVDTGRGWYAEKLVTPAFVEVVFEMNGTPSSVYDTIFFTNGSVNTTRKRGQALVKNGTLVFGISDLDTLDITDRYNEKLSFSIPLNSQVKNKASIWYFCGARVTAPSGTSATNGTPEYLGIGGGWYGMEGNIYCVRFYSRVLTAEEVAFNHQIDRERFGVGQ